MCVCLLFCFLKEDGEGQRGGGGIMVGCNGYECSIVLLLKNFSLHVAIHFLQH